MTINSIGKEIGLAAVNILPYCARAALFGNPVGVAGAAIYGSVGHATRRGCFFSSDLLKGLQQVKRFNPWLSMLIIRGSYGVCSG